MTGDLTAALQAFTTDRQLDRKGPLSVALVVTQHARNAGLPLDPEKLLTGGGGQALRLGKSAVQAILRVMELSVCWPLRVGEPVETASEICANTCSC
jgi:hypothetical protein